MKYQKTIIFLKARMPKKNQERTFSEKENVAWQGSWLFQKINA